MNIQKLKVPDDELRSETLSQWDKKKVPGAGGPEEKGEQLPR